MLRPPFFLMSDYIQPDFYHFSQDSIFLARLVVSDGVDLAAKNLLDLCAGCGVVGLEVTKQLKTIEELCSVEYQEVYIPYIKKNIEMFSPGVKSEIISSSLGELKLKKKYDCIVTNPPYFKAGSGRVSPLPEKQISRTFEIDSLNILLEKIKEYRASTGVAYIVFPSGDLESRELFLQYGYSEYQREKQVSVFKLA